jgi:hypothetical protein
MSDGFLDEGDEVVLHKRWDAQKGTLFFRVALMISP